MAQEGWIAVWRQVKNNWVWDDKPASRFHAWIDLLMRAAHEEDHAVFFMNHVHKLTRGELVTSERILGNEWGWSRTKVRQFIDCLVKEKMIEKKTSDLLRIIIINYDKYQEKPKKKNQEKTNKEPEKDQQKTTNNNYNNGNNVNNTPLYPPKGGRVKKKLYHGKDFCTWIGDELRIKTASGWKDWGGGGYEDFSYGELRGKEAYMTAKAEKQ